jgi:glucose/mannose transport system permease protein
MVLYFGQSIFLLQNQNYYLKYEFWGIDQYFRLWSMPRWHVAVENLFIFTILFIILCVFIGIVLAILLDQKIRAEGFFKNNLLIPNGIIIYCDRAPAWRWILNPSLGIEKFAQDIGFETFTF